MAVSGTGSFGDDVRAWLAECLPRAIVYARSLVRDAGEADDVVQECVYRATPCLTRPPQAKAAWAGLTFVRTNANMP